MAKFERVPRKEKVQQVEFIKDVLANNSVILTDFQGVDVEGMAKIRNKLKEINTNYKVIKNTLLTIAATGTDAEAVVENLSGSTAMLYTNDDVVAAAKTILGFSKGPKPITIKCGYVEGTVLSAKQIDELSKIGSKEELIAAILGSIEAPLSGLVGTLNSMLGDVIWTLDAVIEKKEKTA